MKPKQKQVQLTLPRPFEKVRQDIEKIKLGDEHKALTKFLLMLAAAVIGRVALQYVPSVEPIIPIAILASLILGMKEGFLLGSSAYVISNFFVWGMQGPWTIFQALGAGLAGTLGGTFGKLKMPSAKTFIVLSVIGTAIYEIVINLSGSLLGIGAPIGVLAVPLYFLTSLPFSVTHIISNIIFATALSPLLPKGKEKGVVLFGLSCSKGQTRKTLLVVPK